jgi:hypothetical protein
LAEVLKVDTDVTENLMLPLIQAIWTEERMPEEWRRGLLIKIPEKGDRTRCSNWRGITLLPVPSKILTRIILNRIKQAVEIMVRKEQAGFRTNRSCVDHINILRIIIEQSMEWNSPLYMIFVDLEKAFDKVNKDKMQKILQKFSIPQKNCKLSTRNIQRLFLSSSTQWTKV